MSSLNYNDLAEIGLPVGNNAQTVLIANSAFEWLKSHTTLDIDTDDISGLKDLPPTVKLFVVKFCDIMNMGVGVASETIGSLSHSFDTGSKSALIWQYARELLSDYLKSQVKVTVAKRKWSY